MTEYHCSPALVELQTLGCRDGSVPHVSGLRSVHPVLCVTNFPTQLSILGFCDGAPVETEENHRPKTNRPVSQKKFRPFASINPSPTATLNKDTFVLTDRYETDKKWLVHRIVRRCSYLHQDNIAIGYM